MKKAFEFNFVMQLFLKEHLKEMKQDQAIETQKMASHGLNMAVGLINEIKHFLKTLGLQLEDQHAEGKKEEATSNSKCGAQGSAEEAPLDVAAVVESGKKAKKRSKRRNKHWQLDTTGELHHQCRGGMNRYKCLAQESDEEEHEHEGHNAVPHGFRWLSLDEEIALQEKYADENEICSDIEGETETGSQTSEAAFDTSICSNSSGRSFYQEFYDKKLQCRGGALGASTSKNKQLTEAMKNLAKVVTEMEPTQNAEGNQDEDQGMKELIKELAKAARRWENSRASMDNSSTSPKKMGQALQTVC